MLVDFGKSRQFKREEVGEDMNLKKGGREYELEGTEWKNLDTSPAPTLFIAIPRH